MLVNLDSCTFGVIVLGHKMYHCSYSLCSSRSYGQTPREAQSSQHRSDPKQFIWVVFIMHQTKENHEGLTWTYQPNKKRSFSFFRWKTFDYGASY